MNQITIGLPPSISRDEAKLLLAAKLYEIGKLSLAKQPNLQVTPKEHSLS